MKKMMALTMALIFALSLSACISTTPEEGVPDGSTQTSSQEKPDEHAGGKETEPEQTENTVSEISYEAQKVIDNDQCAVTIQDIEPDEVWGYTIHTLLENKSSEITYMFALNYMAVNGVMCTDLFAEEVAAGKKSNQSLHIPVHDLEENGITEITDIELAFRIYDTNDWEAAPVSEDVVHVYPYGEEKAEKFVREAADTDQILVENDQVTVIATGYGKDDIWGYQVKLYFINKTDASILYSVNDASVNGFMIDPFFASSVAPGCCEFTAFDFGNEQLEENGIETVEKIEFNLRARDAENITDEYFVDEVFTLVPVE